MRKTEIIDGQRYRVTARLGYVHDVGAYAIEVETPDGPRKAVKPPGGAWRFWRPLVLPGGPVRGQTEREG